MNSGDRMYGKSAWMRREWRTWTLGVVVAASMAIALSTIAPLQAQQPTQPQKPAGSSPAASSEKRPAAFHVEEATIADIQHAITTKQITTVKLVNLYLARIKAYNGTCVSQPKGILGPISTIPHAGQLNALITLNLRPAARKAWAFDDRKARSMTDTVDADPKMPDALEVAAAQDRQFAQTGRLVGPLQGVVMAFKDQYDTFDMRTTAGADAFYANDRPPRDATFVARLRAAGAIILAKANLVEYAGGIAPRSSFGGTSCNPYDTERTPSGSSSGSGTSVSANLVTCAIAEETGSSIRGPAKANNVVGLSPTQELVSRDGMMGAGVNTRVGPICRTVEDAARILTVISGYDPRDELTIFSVGRKASAPYETFTRSARLDGVRIGVAREYMDRKAATPDGLETIDLVDRAVGDLRKLGATIVDPGPGGALFQSCLNEHAPQAMNKLFTRQLPKLFPVDAEGKPTTDQVATLVDMTKDPTLVPDTVTLRGFGTGQAEGEGKYLFDRYLRNRGDAAIRTVEDLATKANFFDDPQFLRNPKTARESAGRPQEMNTADRMLLRFAVQELALRCMEDQHLDAITYPTSLTPSIKITAPEDRGSDAWSVLGAQGFPAITVPVGFTTGVFDRIADPAAPNKIWRLATEPTPAKLPVGLDFLGRPFDEPTILRIAAAYTRATQHRMPPPEFGPVVTPP